MKKYIYRIFILLVIVMPALDAYSQTAADVLKSVSNKITASGGVSFSFNMTGETNMKGTFSGSGNKFCLTSGSGSVWYNGDYMWTYNPSSNETTKVKPTNEELAETNPVLFVAANANAFNAEYGNASSGQKVLILTPKNKSTGIDRAVLTLNSKTLLPVKLAVKIKGKTTVINISNLSTGKSFSASTFEYPKSKYPKVPVITL